MLKRFSFIGDGLSHVAFGAMAVASVLNFTNNMIFILPVTVICAVLLLRTGQNTKIKGDAAIAMISVGALAIGYLLMNLFSTGPNLSGDVCSTLFGSTSILTLTKGQVVLCSVLSVIVVVVFIMFYQKFSVLPLMKHLQNYRNENGFLQSANSCYYSGNHRSCHESGWIFADFSIGNISGIVSYACIQDVLSCYNLFSCIICALCSYWDSVVYFGRYSGRLDDCSNRHCGIYDQLCCGKSGRRKSMKNLKKCIVLFCVFS